jgi:hypothetical protein
MKRVGAKPVADIDRADALEILSPFGRGPIQDQMRARFRGVIDYAVSKGWREPGVNPFVWQDLMIHLPASDETPP